MRWLVPLAFAAGALFFASGAIVALFRGYAVALEGHWFRSKRPIAYWLIIAAQTAVAGFLAYIAVAMVVHEYG